MGLAAWLKEQQQGQAVKDYGILSDLTLNGIRHELRIALCRKSGRLVLSLEIRRSLLGVPEVKLSFVDMASLPQIRSALEDAERFHHAHGAS